MPPALLERTAQQEVLRAAARSLEAGESSVVLLSGEAGIGKTSLVNSQLELLAASVRLWRGACDDLVAANPLGPLREATKDTGGRLEAALNSGQMDEVLDASVDGLSGPQPSCLVMEDLHWADDATIDVLAYLVRRIESLRLLLVVTYRDDEVSPDHPMQRLLAALAGRPVHRLQLQPLSTSAVQALISGTGWDARELHQLTGGNPFYLTETLASPVEAAVPTTVSGAVLARAQQLSARCRTTLERISVVPGLVDFPLAEELLGADLDALAEAEDHGIVESRRDGLAFRHEIARRAIEASIPGLRRRQFQRDVTAVLRKNGAPEISRLVHHAVLAGDAEVVAEFAPRAARDSARAGAHRQALIHYTTAMRHEALLEPRELGRVLDEFAWELYNAHRFEEAVAAATRAATLFRELGDEDAQGSALIRLSRHLYMRGQTDDARAAAEHAVRLLENTASVDARAYAVANHGALLALDDEARLAARTLDLAMSLAEQAGRPELRGLCLNYASIARPDLDPAGRVAMLRTSLELALALGEHEYAARGYTNLCELLYRYQRFDELGTYLTEALGFTRERGFWSHTYNLEVHECLLQGRRGNWQAAVEGLRNVVTRYDDPGMLVVYSQPSYARLSARMGAEPSGDRQRQSWQRALRQRSLLGLGFAGIAYVEWAWLQDRPDIAAEVRDAWRPHADRPTAGPLWAELQRYCVRAGLDPELRQGPEHDFETPWTMGLRGDWRAAAAAWQQLGDPFEEALELASSGEVDQSLRGLALLDGLGATAAAVKVRVQLRDLGVRSIPRGPMAATRANPAGLTARQLDVLQLMSEGLTNADIATRLVLSVRTVDHHVSSVLTKLGVSSRQAAVGLARSWEPDGPSSNSH